MHDATEPDPTSDECVHRTERSGLIHDPGISCSAASILFDQIGERLAGRGRGAIRRIVVAGDAVVVRHYRRGGLAARLSEDRFFWTGADTTRSFREFRVLRRLRRFGLPVPAVVSGRWQRSGTTYRADLATREVVGARTLAERLAASEIDIDWEGLGAMLAAFHRVGLWHADLNAHNVIFDAQGRPVLIDFDRAHFIAPGASALRGNIQRLARSLRKLGHQDLLTAQPWQRLQRAYERALSARSIDP